MLPKQGKGSDGPAFAFGRHLDKANSIKILLYFPKLESYLRDSEVHVSIDTRFPNVQTSEFWFCGSK